MIDPYYAKELDELIDPNRAKPDDRLTVESLSCDQCGRYVAGIAQLVDHLESCKL
tara:strand:- start:259 stop:423 length:165 start_codon:yes stop_codon:yes gene_type:complete